MSNQLTTVLLNPALPQKMSGGRTGRRRRAWAADNKWHTGDCYCSHGRAEFIEDMISKIFIFLRVMNDSVERCQLVL